MTKSIVMLLATLQFHVQVKALAHINSCTSSVLFQMRGAKRPEDQSSSGEKEKAGWDTPLAATCKTMVPARYPENKVPRSSSLSLQMAVTFGAEGKLPLGSSGQAARFAVHLWLSMGWSGKESAGQAQRSSASLHPSRCPGSFLL